MTNMELSEIQGIDPWAMGRRIAVTRVALGLRVMDLANEMGWTPQRLVKWEGGNTTPSLLELAKFCDRYGPTMDWLCRGDMQAMPLWLADAIRRIVAQSSSPDQWSRAKKRKANS